MHILKLVMVVGVLGLSGCATGRQETRFDRFDGAAIAPMEFERAKAECSALGEQAALQVPRNYGGLVGAIDHGVNMGNSRVAAERACLARNGIRVTVVTVAEPVTPPPPVTASGAAEPTVAKTQPAKEAKAPKPKAAPKPKTGDAPAAPAI